MVVMENPVLAALLCSLTWSFARFPREMVYERQIDPDQCKSIFESARVLRVGHAIRALARSG